VTTERQKAANRQNARRSTGPRSAEGKARASRNATRHGLTARLLVDDILAWYRLILDDPEAGEEPDGLVEEAALKLAAAETRLARARQAHDQYLLGPDKDSAYEKGKAAFGALIAEAVLNPHQESKLGLQLIKAAARMHRTIMARDQREREQQGRRLLHYLNRAERRREEMLRAFIETAGKDREGEK
jgi:hypothetical protein